MNVDRKYVLSQEEKTRAALRAWDVPELSKALRNMSPKILPAGCGHAFACLGNGELGVWYSLSDMEREFVDRYAMLLFSVRKNGRTTEFAPAAGTLPEQLPYLREKLMPALSTYFTQQLGWTAASA